MVKPERFVLPILLALILITLAWFGTSNRKYQNNARATSQSMTATIAPRPTAIPGTVVPYGTAAANARQTADAYYLNNRAPVDNYASNATQTGAQKAEEAYYLRNRAPIGFYAENCSEPESSSQAYNLGPIWIKVGDLTTWSDNFPGVSTVEILLPPGSEVVVYQGQLNTYQAQCTEKLKARLEGRYKPLQYYISRGDLDVRQTSATPTR